MRCSAWNGAEVHADKNNKKTTTGFQWGFPIGLEQSKRDKHTSGQSWHKAEQLMLHSTTDPDITTTTTV